jgi:hypothetical protein
VSPINRPEAGRALASSAVINARVSANRLPLDAATVTRPVWTRDRVPIRPLSPVDRAESIVVGRHVIQPYPHEGTAYIGALQASLLNFSLTIYRQALPDRGVAITGGMAVLSISTYVTMDLVMMAGRRIEWNAALQRGNFAGREWSYRAETRRGLDVSLELPDGVAKASPAITTSPAAGAATIRIELTENGALAWKAALEQGAAATIPGVVHITTSGLAAAGAAMRIDSRSLDTSIGELLATRGASDIRYVDPQQTVIGKLIVVTNDLVEKITIALRPNRGLAPASSTFGPEGGVLEVPVTTQDVQSVAFDWTTQVAFTPAGWPPVPASGQLNASNSWTEMLKPDSWIATYTLMVIPVDAHGQAQPLEAAGGTTQLQVVLNFTAPYVANGLLNSSFEAEYLRPFNMALPRYPGQPFGDVVLTMFATRGGVGGMKSRKLAAEELNIVALVYPDGRVEMRTSFDALPEHSSAADVLRLMEAS